MIALRVVVFAWAGVALCTAGSVSGRVIGQPGGRPLGGAEISVAAEATFENGEALVRTQRSLGDGRFAFDDIPAGGYVMGFSKGGYEGGSRASLSVEVTDAEPDVEVDLELRRSGVIAGRVSDPDGDPIQDAIIHLREWNTVQGRRRLRAISSSRTDDLGAYRLHNLRPGKYIVSVMPRNMIAPRGVLAYEFGPVSYPNAPTPSQASVLPVLWGTVNESVDFRLDWSPDTAIEGATLTPEGGQCGECFVNLADEGGAVVGALTVTPEGYFAIRGAQPGAYRLTVRSRGTQDVGSEAVFVTEGKPVEVVLQPSPGSSVSGRVVSEGAPPDKETSDQQGRMISVQVRALDPSGATVGQRAANVDWTGDGEFTLDGLSPGSYYVRVGRPPAGSYVREFSLGGQPLRSGEFQVGGVPVNGLEVRLAFDAGRVEGTVDKRPRARKGAMAVQGLVVLLPDDYGVGPYVELLGAYRSEDGKFDIPNVPPGSYKVFAVSRNNSFDLGDPDDAEFLRRKGNRVQVGARATTNATAPFVANR